MKVTCDVCKNEFDTMLKEQTKTINGHEIYRTFMKCPTCGAEYDICYDDMSTLALKKKIKKQTQKLQSVKGNKYLIGLKKLRENQNQLGLANNKLQLLYNNEKGE